MTKLLKKWLKNTKANLIVIALLFIYSFVYANDPIEQVRQSANQVNSLYNTSNGINLNASQPLTSPSKLKTIDKQKSYELEITKPSSKAFLNIQVKGSRDLSIKVNQDLDFDGLFDYSFNVPFLVSGICSNGIVSCDEGTWNNCKFYIWQSDSGKTRLSETGITDLKNCFRCNQGGTRDYKAFLNTLGGGVIGVIQTEKPQYTITNAKTDNNSITYYGQDTSAGDTKAEKLKNYISNPASLKTDAEKTALLTSDDNIYTNIQKSAENRGDNAEYKSCKITRNITINELTIDDIVSSIGGSGSINKCGNNCIEIVMGVIGQDYWWSPCQTYEHNYKLFMKRPDLVEKATIEHVVWEDHIEILIGRTKVYHGHAGYPFPCCVQLWDTWYRYPNTDVTNAFKKYGEIDTRVRVTVVVAGSGYARVRLYLKTSYDIIENIQDNCKNYEDNNCALYYEKTDNTETYKNFNPTGNSSLPSTRQFKGETISKSFTRDWWDKDRQYLCKNNEKFNFNEALAKTDKTVESAGENEIGQDNYSYLDFGSNNKSVQLPETMQGTSELICKTVKVKQDDRVGVWGETSSKKDNTKQEVFYKKCIDNKCPVGSDEKIVKDCQAINEFGEAAALMGVLQEAGKDLECEGDTDSNGGCPSGWKIFKGEPKKCLCAGLETMGFDCCDADKDSFLILKERCKEESIKVSQAVQSGRNHQVGTYCKKKFLGICLQKVEGHCLFNSKLGRIVNEQAKLQIPRLKTWGSAESPFCDGITPEEFSSLDFSKIDFTEIFGDLNPNTDKAKTNIENSVNNFYENVQNR